MFKELKQPRLHNTEWSHRKAGSHVQLSDIAEKGRQLEETCLWLETASTNMLNKMAPHECTESANYTILEVKGCKPLLPVP